MNNDEMMATLAAIGVMRDLDRWPTVPSVGQGILVRAWLRLEREALLYLTGGK